MTDIVPFDFNEYRVRVIMKDGEPWLVAGDVCGVLDIVNVADAMTRLDPGDIGQTEVMDKSGKERPGTWIVNESGLYDLVMRSNKPEAKKFRRWITSEVLPSIRKTGGYQHTPATYLDALKALVATEEQRQVLTAQVAELAPKAEDFDAFMAAPDDCYTMNQVAKTLNTGRTRLMKFLREEGVIFHSKDAAGSLAYQTYIDKGWFVNIFQPNENGHGYSNVVYVTPAGVSGVRRLWTAR
jgi:prophage antirepressor-like protein